MKKSTKTLLIAILIAFFSTVSNGQTEPYYKWSNPQPQGNQLNAMAYSSATEGIAIGNNGACLATNDGGQSWTDLDLYPHFQADLYDVIYLGGTSYLAAGELPGLYRTDDAGHSWDTVSNPATHDLRDLHMIDSNIITAGGFAGNFLRSEDGGLTWTDLSIDHFGNILDQFWHNSQQGYVVGDFIAKQTIDGGISWTDIPDITSSLQGTSMTYIHFLDANNGWILDHFNTFRTEDGGLTWFEKHGQFAHSPIYQDELVFYSADHRLATVGIEGAQIWETFDDGLNWTLLYERLTTGGYTDIHEMPDGRLNICSSDGDHLTSTDQGQTWTNFTLSPEDLERNDLETLAKTPDGTMWAGGREGLLMNSLDMGESWNLVQGQVNLTTIQDIQFFNSDFGLIGGYKPNETNIFRSTDGGLTWSSHEIASSYVGYKQEISIVSTTTAFAVTWGGTGVNHVFRTDDGGVSWTDITAGLTDVSQLASIEFLDEDVGFVAGGVFSSDAQIWKTIDGGASWSPLPETGLPQGQIRAMHWFSSNEGFVASVHGLAHTTNGGQTWTTRVNDSFTSIHFRDTQNGVASSYLDRYFYQTDNGGITWTQLEYVWTGAPNDSILTEQGAFLCGSGNVIFQVDADLICLNTGDVNLDGEITASDAQQTFMIALGSWIPTMAEECAADCNGDDNVTAGDAQQVFLVVLGSDSCVEPV